MHRNHSMALTLLIDLDDTLLETNLDVFVPTYYKALSTYLADVAPPKELIAALQAGVGRMMQNLDPSRTLQEVFEADFYPRLGLEAAPLREKIMKFYREVYPSLGRTTRPREGARELVDWALAAGHEVAIATDPLFPLIATEERVRWAGFDPAEFALISAFGSFHFTKSDPAYYAEMLGRLGWPDRPVLMAGDDSERDLMSAKRLGISTFHVVREPGQDGSASGDLRTLKQWIETHGSEIQAPDLKSKEAILAVLRSTPAVLQGLTADLTPADWAHEPAPDEWAMIELVCHLRDTEREVHALQLETLLATEDPFVARPDAAYWAKQRRYHGEVGLTAVQEFAVARLASLERLRDAPADAWSKPARHAIFGPTNFLEVIGFMAEHDRLHIQQAWRTLPADAPPAS
jgi:FMN phosphatase YigB (HAD superfamily)